MEFFIIFFIFAVLMFLIVALSVLLVYLLVKTFSKGGDTNMLLGVINPNKKKESLLRENGKMSKALILNVENMRRTFIRKGKGYMGVVITLEVKLPDGRIKNYQNYQYIDIAKPIIKGSIVDIVYNDTTDECVVVI